MVFVVGAQTTNIYLRMKRPCLPLPAVQTASIFEVTKCCSTTNVLSAENYWLYGIHLLFPLNRWEGPGHQHTFRLTYNMHGSVYLYIAWGIGMDSALSL